MFSVITNLYNTFDKTLDEEKLKTIKKMRVRDSETIEEKKIIVHEIMRKHYQDEHMIKISKEVLAHLDFIKNLRVDLIKNTYVSKNFKTQWAFEACDLDEVIIQKN